MEALIRAENLTRILNGDVDVTLVSGASLQVSAGEFVSITGPSGSGKSSLLYLLGLLDKPTSGKLYVAGQDTLSLDEAGLAKIRLENMGFVFQFHFLLPEFTVLENVMMPMKRLGNLTDRQAREKGVSLLSDMGIADQADKLPRKLSGGQCQRVAIARALANDPAIILADEPTGNLDSASSKVVQGILQKLAHDHGRAVIVVTHDMDFAATADRKIRLVDGKISSDRLSI
ncbi:MAG: ABC transporter ATP-binding protein [Micavibrio aeruginosavorus]|uniref:ABC transporter ATP-binding protein n=1 Tax=Micavibrio aeruginosavorus TaxID=349221 RepID=A0A7T5R3W1_9BACT|nr:MAG: ABC transporter ATP-binding protein [Micavibrio aeruginosavorus]